MASEYTTRLGFEKQEPGENFNQWGERLNNVEDLIDEAIAGRAEISLTGNHTLTNTLNEPNQARKATLIFTDGGLTAAPTVTIPAKEKRYYVENLGSTYAITFTAGGTTGSVPAGATCWVNCDGTNVKVFDPVADSVAASTSYVMSSASGEGIVITEVDGSAQVAADFADETEALDEADATHVMNPLRTFGAIDHSINQTTVDRFIQDEASDGDMRAAFDRAFSSLGSGGGVVLLRPGRDYHLSGLEIPPLCTIQGPYAHIDTYADGIIGGGHGTFRYHKGLILDPLGSIETYGSAGLVDCFVKRDGWAHTDIDDSLFAGLMMDGLQYAPILKNVLALGFDKILRTGEVSRVYIDKLYADAKNGLDLGRSADVSRITNVQLWPFATIEAHAAAAVPDDTDLRRSGTALKMAGGTAGGLLDSFFALGFDTGMDITGSSTLNVGRVRFEAPESEVVETVGVKYGSGADAVYIASLCLAGYEKMVQINTTANNRLDVGFLEAHLGAGTILEVLSGDITVRQWYSYLRDGIIIDVQNNASQVNINGYHRTGGGYTITDYVKVPTNGRTDRIKVDLRTEQVAGGSMISGGPFIVPAMTDTAGVINVPPQSDRNSVGSSVALTTINGGYTGRKVSVHFLTARQILNTGNIRSALPFNVAANEIIEFLYDGEKWTPLNKGDIFSVNLAANTATSFTPLRASGFVEVFAEASTTEYGKAFFRVGASPAMATIFLGSSATVGTGVLTGTTGASNSLNITAAVDGNVYVENRVGATRTIVIKVSARP